MFPSPTGRNGFEEFFRAADMVGPSDTNQLAKDKTVTPAQLLREKRVRVEKNRQAIQLVLLGLTKPCKEPRTAPSFTSEFPELTAYKNLGRLITYRADVQFADGHTAEGARTIRQGLKFGQTISQGPTLVHVLVGTAIQMMTIRGLSTHISEIPPSEFAKVLMAAKSGTDSVPLALSNALGHEFQNDCEIVRSLTQHHIPDELKETSRSDPGVIGVIDLLAQFQGGVVSARQLSRLKRDWQDLSPALEQARLHDLDRGKGIYLRELKQCLASPESEWRTMPYPFADWDLRTMFALVAAVKEVLFDSQARLRLQYRLLAVSISVLEYRSRQGRYPASLDQLRRPELVIDPFTHRSFSYSGSASAFEVSSPGPAGSKHQTLGHAQRQ